jgi:tetraacyldisaccharide 4'-kinase
MPIWRSPLRFLLLPFAAIFACLAWMRRLAYRHSFLQAIRLPVPVLIVGNITAGGTGKTPLVAFLAQALAEQGYAPGILSRGYGGKVAGAAPVEASSRPEIVGDEPMLLAKLGFPVWVGKKRAAAGKALLAAHPECDVLICDDGLQHYALHRNFEIAVIDGKTGLGNGLPLPAGPLREPPSRLKNVDAIVVNGGGFEVRNDVPSFEMRLCGNRFVNVDQPGLSADAHHFSGKRIHAIAGIGNPQRFFDHLSGLGLQFVPHPFPDHHPYSQSDLEFDACDILLMTEKDAIKCIGFAPGKCWFLQVNAEIDLTLVETIVKTIGKSHGS